MKVHPSPSGSYIVVECLGDGLPQIFIYNTFSQDFWLFENNTKLINDAVETVLPYKRTFKIELENDLMATVHLMLPPSWRELDEIKYPIIIEG